MAAFKRLVRFSTGTQIHYGDLISVTDKKYTVRRLEGSPFSSLKSTENIHHVDYVRGSFEMGIVSKLTRYSSSVRLKERLSCCVSV